MCVFFHRRHTETSTEGVQAGGVVVFIARGWQITTTSDTQHRRPQESLQGTNRDHKGKYKGWWKQETYKRIAHSHFGKMLYSVNNSADVHYIYYRGLNAGHDKGLQNYYF